MEEVRKLLRESRAALEAARKDLEECQRIQNALSESAQQHQAEKKRSGQQATPLVLPPVHLPDSPPPPPSLPPSPRKSSSAASAKKSVKESDRDLFGMGASVDLDGDGEELHDHGRRQNFSVDASSGRQDLNRNGNDLGGKDLNGNGIYGISLDGNDFDSDMKNAGAEEQAYNSSKYVPVDLDAANFAESKPRKASVALSDAAENRRRMSQYSGHGRSFDGGAGEDVDDKEGVDDEDADDESDDEASYITTGLNIGGAEDQIVGDEDYEDDEGGSFYGRGTEGEDDEVNSAYAPVPTTTRRQSQASRASVGSRNVPTMGLFPVEEDEAMEDLMMLLPPPPKLERGQNGFSMRTLRRASQVPVGDGTIDPDAAKEATEDAPEDEEEARALMEPMYVMMRLAGYMRKLPSTGKLFASPHMRYFMLDGNLLSYSVKSESASVRRILKLDGATCTVYVQEPKRENSGKPRIFYLYIVPASPIERKMRISTESEEEARQWHAAINNNILCAAEKKELNLKEMNRLRRTESRRTSQVGMDMTEKPRTLPQTYYDILGVPPDAKLPLIRKTYYNLAKNFHPDKNRDVDTKAFAEIGRAYSILKDKKLRASYDLCETVKAAFRLGVVAVKHEEDGAYSRHVVFFLDRYFENLVWQPVSRGSVLKPGYSRIELRYIHRIYAGEDDKSLRFGELRGGSKEKRTAKAESYGESYGSEDDSDDDESDLDQMAPNRRQNAKQRSGRMNAEEEGSDAEDGQNEDDEVGDEDDEDDNKADMDYEERVKYCVSLQMSPHAKKIGYSSVFIELDTKEARDDILDGLRVLRCGASMLFQQNLDEMKEEGLR